MPEYRICTFCVMDTSDPKIEFNSEGRCNHCISAVQKLSTGCMSGSNGRNALDELANRLRMEKGSNEYDSIVGVSGGIDSSYLLHLVKKEMGLNPLVVHVDSGWNSEIAVSNIEKMIKKLGLDLFTYVVDWDEMRELQLAFLKASVANQDIPQDHAFFAKLYEFAVAKNIKNVITGSNLTSESILPASWGYDAMDLVHVKDIYRKFGPGGKLKSYPAISFWKYKIYYPYVKKMTVHKPLNWIDYDKNKAMEFLIKEYGWQYYGGKHLESRWTKFFQTYYLPKKFGYDKRRAHLSSMIAAGQLSRAVALNELESSPFDKDDVQSQMAFIAKKLGIDKKGLEKLIALPNKTYLDYKNHERLLRIFRSIKRRLSFK